MAVMSWLLGLWKPHVYTVVANDGPKVRECLVVASRAKASREFHRLRATYGGANVALCSRRVG